MTAPRDPSTAACRALLRRSLLALAACAALVAVCYFFVDRPVAFFVYDHGINHSALLRWLTYPPVWCELAAPAVIVVTAVRLAWGRPSRPEWTLFAAAVSILITLPIKDQLKALFGRYWPDTWIDNNPSLIGSGAYGFHPFHDGPIYGDFPSGHTARIFSVMAVAWIAYPQWRPLPALACASVIVGLIGMDYHFVGDVIAGGTLGALVAMYTAHFLGLDARAGGPAATQ